MIKLKILTIFEDWSFPKVKKHFDASTHMITVCKTTSNKGILSTPHVKSRRAIVASVHQYVVAFYCSDDVSRIMSK